MSLPDESLEVAAEIAAEWQDDPAKHIYEYLNDMDYGLSGALDRGLNVRHLHQNEGQVNCYEHAIHAYTLAKALDLTPRFFEVEEGQASHAFIDIEHNGERVHIDQGRYGPVKYYGDTEVALKESPVTDNTTRTYKSITQKSEDELIQDINDLQNDTGAMISRGQRLTTFEHDGKEAFDKIIYHEDDNLLERMISFYEPHGFFNHLVRIRHHLNDDGIEQTEALLADIESSGWNETRGERPIGIINEDSFTPVDEFPTELREQIGTVMAYETQADGELVYTDEEREQFWETYQNVIIDQIKDGYTAFHGKQFKNTIEKLQRLQEQQPERFHRNLDWMLFLNNTDIPVPDDEDIYSLLPSYIERHTDIIDEARSQEYNSAIDTIIEDITSEMQTNEDIPFDDHIDKVQKYGYASIYEELAGELETLQNDSSTSLEQYQSLLIANPELHQHVTAIVSRLVEEQDDELKDIYQTLNDLHPGRQKTLEGFQHDVNETWEIKRDDQTLKQTLTLDDARTSLYNPVIDIEYDIDPTSDDTEIEISLYDTADGVEERHTYGTVVVDEIDDIDLETVQDLLYNNIDSITTQRTLTAPDPERDEHILEKNPEAIAVYSLYFRDEEETPHLWSQEELDEFNQTIIEETDIALASPFNGVADKEQIREEREIASGDLEDHWDHYTAAQHNKIKNLKHLAPERLKTHIDHEFTLEQQVEQYAKRFYDTLDELVLGEDNLRKTQQTKKTIEDGLIQSLPSKEDIDGFASESGIDNLADINNIVDNPGYSWERKATLLEQNLDGLEEKIDNIETPREKERMKQSLLAIQTRFHDHARYQEWDEDGSLDEQFNHVREAVREYTPFQDKSDAVPRSVIKQHLSE